MENYLRVLTLEQGNKVLKYLESIKKLKSHEIFSETNNFGIDITPVLGYEFALNAEFNYEENGKNYYYYSLNVKDDINKKGGLEDYINDFLCSLDELNNLVNFVKSIE
jgi:hypothetical protein